MVKIALIAINKNPSSGEWENPERLLISQTAEVEKVPIRGELFAPTTASGAYAVYKCLRTNQDGKLDSIDGHDAVVYAMFSHVGRLG